MEQDYTRSDRIPMIRAVDKHPSTSIELIRKNLCLSWIASLVRIGVIVLVFAFKDILLVENVWGFLFYLLLGLIDIISLIGEINTYQFLRKEKLTLQNIEDQKRQGVQVTERVRVGPYSTYLSDYETIYQYKFAYKPTASSYTIIRYLHTITSFGIFGALALKECKSTQACTYCTFIQTFILALTISSVYIINFEADYLQLEISKGKYQEIESLSDSVKQQIIKKFVLWRRVVALSYTVLLCVLCAGLPVLIWSENPSDVVGLIVVLSLVIVMVVCNIWYQVYYIRKRKLLSSRVSCPIYTDRVCSPHHLLYQLKSSHPKSFILLNSGMRIVVFCLFMTTMYYSASTKDSTMSVLLSGVCLCALSEIIKMAIGHRLRIDYFSPVTLTVDKKAAMICSICLCNYVEDSVQIELPCSPEHTFHKDCLDNWLRSKQQCPLCRYDLAQFMK